MTRYRPEAEGVRKQIATDSTNLRPPGNQSRRIQNGRQQALGGCGVGSSIEMPADSIIQVSLRLRRKIAHQSSRGGSSTRDGRPNMGRDFLGRQIAVAIGFLLDSHDRRQKGGPCRLLLLQQADAGGNQLRPVAIPSGRDRRVGKLLQVRGKGYAVHG